MKITEKHVYHAKRPLCSPHKKLLDPKELDSYADWQKSFMVLDKSFEKAEFICI